MKTFKILFKKDVKRSVRADCLAGFDTDFVKLRPFGGVWYLGGALSEILESKQMTIMRFMPWSVKPGGAADMLR